MKYKHYLLIVAIVSLLTNCNKTPRNTGETTISSTHSSDTSYPVANHFPMDPKYNSYYSNINFGQSKENLKSSLTSKISGHTTLNYSGVLSAMKSTDRDWKLSPSSSDSNPYMRLLYGAYNGSTSSAQRYSTNNTVWDREHIWPQSHGNFGTSAGIGTDLHHLRASDKPNNNARSSFDFASVPLGATVNDYSGRASGRKGSTTLANKQQGTAYEPQDSDKGDIARALFYMATRYANDSLKFTLVDGFTNNSANNARIGVLSELISWHSLDPVDEFEMNRNNLIYENHQHNRNPYIDHPELVYTIFA